MAESSIPFNMSSSDEEQDIDDSLLEGVPVPFTKIFKKYYYYFSVLQLTETSVKTLEQLLPMLFPDAP
jgi:hypothetical protein